MDGIKAERPFNGKKILKYSNPSYIGKKGIGSGNVYRASCLPPMSEKFT